jgi:hypothetical protein
LKRSETAETISQNHKQIERLMPKIPSETLETTAITEGGLSAPPWSFRFTPFLGGETVKRETEMAAQHERRQEAQVKRCWPGLVTRARGLGKSSHAQLHFPVEIS